MLCVLWMCRPQGHVFHTSCLGRVLFSGPILWRGVCFDPGLIPRLASVNKRANIVGCFTVWTLARQTDVKPPRVKSPVKPYAAGPRVLVPSTITCYSVCLHVPWPTYMQRRSSGGSNALCSNYRGHPGVMLD